MKLPAVNVFTKVRVHHWRWSLPCCQVSPSRALVRGHAAPVEPGSVVRVRGSEPAALVKCLPRTPSTRQEPCGTQNPERDHPSSEAVLQGELREPVPSPQLLLQGPRGCRVSPTLLHRGPAGKEHPTKAALFGRGTGCVGPRRAEVVPVHTVSLEAAGVCVRSATLREACLCRALPRHWQYLLACPTPSDHVPQMHGRGRQSTRPDPECHHPAGWRQRG